MKRLTYLAALFITTSFTSVYAGVEGFNEKEFQVVESAFALIQQSNWHNFQKQDLETLAKAATIAGSPKNPHYNPSVSHKLWEEIINVVTIYDHPISKVVQTAFKNVVLGYLKGENRRADISPYFRNQMEVEADLRKAQSYLHRAKRINFLKTYEPNGLSTYVEEIKDKYKALKLDNHQLSECENADRWDKHNYSSLGTHETYLMFSEIRDFAKRCATAGKKLKAESSGLLTGLKPFLFPKASEKIEELIPDWVNIEEIENTIKWQHTKIAHQIGLVMVNPGTQEQYHLFALRQKGDAQIPEENDAEDISWDAQNSSNSERSYVPITIEEAAQKAKERYAQTENGIVLALPPSADVNVNDLALPSSAPSQPQGFAIDVNVKGAIDVNVNGKAKKIDIQGKIHAQEDHNADEPKSWWATIKRVFWG